MGIMKKGILILIYFFVIASSNGQGNYDAVLSAISLSSTGKTGEAVTVLTAEIEKGETPDLYLLRGELFLKDSNIKEARKDFMAAENKKTGSGMYDLARCAALTGDAVAAASYLERHLKSGYKKSEPEIMLDSTFNAISPSSEWKSLWKKEWYKGFERKKWEMEHYIRIGNNDLASEVLTYLEAEYPDMPVTEYCRALLDVSKGLYREAIDILTPMTVDQDPAPEYMLVLAKAHAGDRNYFESARIYDRLISSAYPDAGLYLVKAEMLYKAGDNTGAVTDLRKFLLYFPDDFQALSLLGKAYAEEGSIFEALPYLNRNIENHPGEPGAFRLRGDAWFATRTWDKAVYDYTMSLDLDPENPAVNLNLGITLINCDRKEDACHYLRKAKDLGEKDATAYLSKYCIK